MDDVNTKQQFSFFSGIRYSPLQFNSKKKIANTLTNNLNKMEKATKFDCSIVKYFGKSSMQPQTLISLCMHQFHTFSHK